MIIEQIDAGIKTAMKEKNEIVLSSLRNLKAAVKNAEIEKGGALTDDDVLKVVVKKVKQHKDSIESFVAGNRTDLADTERAQMQVLSEHFPKQMDESEVAKIVTDTIAKLNATSADFGKVMKEVVVAVKGQADGSIISKLVKEKLK